MSAAVIALPTAADAPVVQPRRRGKLPKSVRSLAVFRHERDMKRIDRARERREGMLELAQRLYVSVSRDECLGLAVVMKKKDGPDMGSAAGVFVDDVPSLQDRLRNYARLVAVPDADRGQL